MTAADDPTLVRLLDYDLWANVELAAALAGNPTPGKALAVYAHLLAAHAVWQNRVAGTGGANLVDLWPPPRPSCFAEDARAARRRWDAVLAGRDTGETFTYTNTAGRAHTSTVADTLTHLAVHGGYHRGQVALLLGQQGRRVPVTDYIHAARGGHL